MTHNRPFRRLSAALVGLTFLLAVQSTAAGWRQCPHHDQLDPAHAAGAEHHAGHAPETPATPDHDDGPCSCLTGAQCAVPVALPAAPGAHVLVAGTVATAPFVALAHQAPARIPSHYLPEATAPPVVL